MTAPVWSVTVPEMLPTVSARAVMANPEISASVKRKHVRSAFAGGRQHGMRREDLRPHLPNRSLKGIPARSCFYFA
jgi:hypothetical protein